MRKIIMFFCSLLPVLLPLAGCVKAKGINELVVWGELLNTNYNAVLEKDPGNLKAAYSKAVFDEFYAEFPEAKVSVVNMGWAEALNQQFMNAAKAHTLPDICFSETYVPVYAKTGLLKPLAIDKAVLDDVIPSVYTAYQHEGQTYGVPVFTGVFALFYYKPVLEEAGIPESKWIPETWDDFLENCGIVADNFRFSNGKVDIGGMLINNAGNMISAYSAYPWLRQAGAEFTDAAGNITFNGENAVRAFEFIREAAKTIPTNSADLSEDAIASLFLKGKAAYMIYGPWMFSSIPEDEIDDYGVCRLPLPESGTNYNSLVGSVVPVITADCKNERMANGLINILLKAETQKLLIDAYSRLPVIKSIYEDSEEVLKDKSHLSVFFDILQDDNLSCGIPAFPKNSLRIWDVWASAYYKILTTNNDIPALLDQLQSDTAKLV